MLYKYSTPIKRTFQICRIVKQLFANYTLRAYILVKKCRILSSIKVLYLLGKHNTYNLLIKDFLRKTLCTVDIFCILYHIKIEFNYGNCLDNVIGNVS